MLVYVIWAKMCNYVNQLKVEPFTSVVHNTYVWFMHSIYTHMHIEPHVLHVTLNGFDVQTL